MSEGKYEQLSMLVDGEIDSQAQQAIDNLISDNALSGAWQRYHLISDALRDGLPEYIDSKLAERISAAIKDEPTILAPGNVRIRTYLKPLAGLAVAASVATVAILGLQQWGDKQEGAGNQPLVAQQAQPEPQPQLEPARQYSFPSRTASIGADQPPYQISPVSTRYNSYLVNYNETHSGMRGMLPYVRIIAHENEK